MTEDILFDNIYIGHSVEDAKKLAEETFEIRKPLEVAEEKEKETSLDDDEDESKMSFKEDPVEYVRQKVWKFIDLAKLDPILAYKTYPETAIPLTVAVLTWFGMLGSLVGIIGSSQKPITKKVRAYTPRQRVISHRDLWSFSHPRRQTQRPLTAKRRKRLHLLHLPGKLRLRRRRRKVQ